MPPKFCIVEKLSAGLSAEWQFPSPQDPWSGRAILSYFRTWLTVFTALCYISHLSSGWAPITLTPATQGVSGQGSWWSVQSSFPTQHSVMEDLLWWAWQLSGSSHLPQVPGMYKIIWGDSLAGAHQYSLSSPGLSWWRSIWVVVTVSWWHQFLFPSTTAPAP